MISNQCLLLTQHDKQHLKTFEKILILHIFDGFHPSRGVILRNFSILFKKPSKKLMSFLYQSKRNLNFKPFFQPLLSLTFLTEITYFVWIETWRAQVSQLYEFPKSYFSHSLFKALSVSRISGQFYFQKFWASRALRTAPKLVLRYHTCDIKLCLRHVFSPISPMYKNFLKNSFGSGNKITPPLKKQG